MTHCLVGKQSDILCVHAHTMHASPPYCRSTIGVDPGSVNFSIARLRLRGFRYDRNRNEQIPLVEPLDMELWNLKTGRGMRRDTRGKGDRYAYFETGVPVVWAEATTESCIAQMNLYIAQSPWLFEHESAEDDPLMALPTVTVENQFDHIKSRGNKWDMFLISNCFASSIDANDKQQQQQQQKRLYERQFAKSAKKYGLSHNGELDYDARKETSVTTVYALFRILGLTQWIAYLDSVVGSGQKRDDLCDAFLLALHYAIQSYEATLKKKKTSGTVTPCQQQPQRYLPEECETGMSMLQLVALAKNGATGDSGEAVSSSSNKPTDTMSFHLRTEPYGSMTTDVFPKLLSEQLLDSEGRVIKTIFPENCGADDDDDDDDDIVTVTPSVCIRSPLNKRKNTKSRDTANKKKKTTTRVKKVTPPTTVKRSRKAATQKVADEDKPTKKRRKTTDVEES